MPRLRTLRAIGALALLTAVGTVGLAWIEGVPLFDALYFTVVTLSTVGYGDFVPQTQAGRLFVMVLIASGVGSALYLLSMIAGDIMEGRLLGDYQRERRQREIDRLDGHVIVCGFGRFGKVVVDELRGGGRPVVVVETDPESETDLRASGVAFVLGNATDDATLQLAGIERATALVVAMSSAADGVFITLSAKELNPAITVHVRTESEAAIGRLRRAGADHVISPFQMGGVRLAASVLNPAVVDFLELSLTKRTDSLGMEEVKVELASAIEGRSVRDIEEMHPHLRIVARKRAGRTVELVLEPTEQVSAGDHLVVIGESGPLKRLAVEAGAS